jgi:protein-L-isoaspartate(D-aspartate) O-methyltransferase
MGCPCLHCDLAGESPAPFQRHVVFPVAGGGKRDYLDGVKNIAVPILMALSILPREKRGQTNAVPAGEEDRFVAERRRMLEEQLSSSGYGITNARVLAAMSKVPRHEFVPPDLRHRAYDDGPLSIGYGQTISQPYIVAFMTEHLDLKPTDRVLEIGTGSGYQAAVLGELAGEVYTIEIVDELAQRAKADLNRLGYANIQVRAGDGYRGWPEAAPFDAVIVTCAPEQVPPPLVDQLKEGGRMIIPIGPNWDQNLVLLHKQGGRLEKRAVLPVRFVPMTGQVAHETGLSNQPATTAH